MAKKHIEVTEKELADLIRNCRRVDVVFGPGWAGVTYDEDAADDELPDYVLRLGALRGVTNENCDGAGI